MVDPELVKEVQAHLRPTDEDLVAQIRELREELKAAVEIIKTLEVLTQLLPKDLSAYPGVT